MVGLLEKSASPDSMTMLRPILSFFSSSLSYCNIFCLTSSGNSFGSGVLISRKRYRLLKKTVVLASQEKLLNMPKK